MMRSFSLEWKDGLWEKFVTAAPRPRMLSGPQFPFADEQLDWSRLAHCVAGSSLFQHAKAEISRAGSFPHLPAASRHQ